MKVGLIRNDCVPIKGKSGHRHTQTEFYANTKTENGVSYPQAEECSRLPVNRFFMALRGTNPAVTLTSVF